MRTKISTKFTESLTMDDDLIVATFSWVIVTAFHCTPSINRVRILFDFSSRMSSESAGGRVTCPAFSIYRSQPGTASVRRNQLIPSLHFSSTCRANHVTILRKSSVLGPQFLASSRSHI